MTDEAQTNPQAGEIWLASEITQLFGLDTRTTARLLVAAVQRCGGLDDAVAQPLSTGDAWLTGAGAEAVFQMAYDTAHNDGTIPARFATPRQTRDQILAHWRDFLTPRDNECTHEVTHTGVCVACGTADDSPEDRDVYDGDDVNRAIDAAEALEEAAVDAIDAGLTPADDDDRPEETGLTGHELAEEYAANDAQTRRELAAGDDSAIRDDSWEEGHDGTAEHGHLDCSLCGGRECAPKPGTTDGDLDPMDSPEFREDRVADGTHARKLSATALEIERLFTEEKESYGYPERVDGMELSHRLFDFHLGSWVGPNRYAVSDLERGEIIRMPSAGVSGSHVITRVEALGDGQVRLRLLPLSRPHRLRAMDCQPQDRDFTLRLDLLYLEAGVPETDVPAAQPSGGVRTLADSGMPERVDDLELRLNPWAAPGQLMKATVADVCRGDVIRGDRRTVDRIVLTALHGLTEGSSLTLRTVFASHSPLPLYHDPETPVWIRRDVAYVPAVEPDLEPESRSAWDLGEANDSVDDDAPERLALAPAYRGIPVPTALWPNLDGPEFAWWCRGVRAALNSGTTEDRDDGR